MTAADAIDEPARRRDWSGIGCAVFIAAFFAVVVYYRWPDPDGDLVRQRQIFAEYLVHQGAILAPADASHPANPQFAFSPRRLRLGDKPYSSITLPYGSSEHFVVSRAKELFPEVVEWSVLPPETALARLLGGAEAVDVVRNPDRFEVQRLKGEVLPHSSSDSLANHPAQGDPFPVPPEIAARITAALLNPDAYAWGGAHMCDPVPGVRLTWYRGDDQVDVLFCFECGILDTYWNERPIVSQGFDATYNDLAAAMKELFPDDQQIQGIELKEAKETTSLENGEPAADDTFSVTTH